jgi:hypothetical protein
VFSKRYICISTRLICCSALHCLTIGKSMLMNVQLAPLASGSANFTVICFDDGNSLYGGKNQSLSATIIVEITRPNSPPFFQLSRTVFSFDSSTVLFNHSFQPFFIYSPSRDYVKNSISRLSINLSTGNMSTIPVNSQFSRSFDPLTQLLPLSVRRRTVNYVAVYHSEIQFESRYQSVYREYIY